MGLYALVQNGVVVSTGDIPVTYKNVGGFNLIQNDAVYKQYGFLPFIYTDPTYDAWTQTVGDYIYIIGDDSVTGTREVIALQPQVIEDQRQSFIKTITAIFNDTLYNTDWAYSPYSDLTADQSAAYTALRTSMVAAKAKIKNLTAPVLGPLLNSLTANLADFKQRLEDFSDSMTAFKALVDGIGA